MIVTYYRKNMFIVQATGQEVYQDPEKRLFRRKSFQNKKYF
jgi:hypothetical protein